MMHRRTLLLAGATLFLTACARTLVEPLSSTRGVEPEKMQKIIREALSGAVGSLFEKSLVLPMP